MNIVFQIFPTNPVGHEKKKQTKRVARAKFVTSKSTTLFLKAFSILDV